MIIWLLTSEFPPEFGGGISTYCLETAQMLSSYGHDVTVLTHNYKVNNITFSKKDNYRVARFNPIKYYTTSFLGHEANLSYAFAKVVEEIAGKEGVPDIVESQEYLGIAYYMLQYKWLQYPIFKDLKILVTLHAPSFIYLEYNQVPYYKLPYFWIGEMERFCIRSADMLISPSQYLVNELKDRLKTNDLDIHILKNPFKTENTGDQENIKKNKIVFFGKLIPQKGCLELLSYFKQLWKEGFEHPLLMIGGGNHLYHPEGIDMIDFINRKYKTEIQKGKLQLLGSIPPQQLHQHIKDAHIIIIPSIVDNLPYTVLEVMGQGKIVLASNQGGQSEIIENKVDGFLFDHHEPASFKNQLKNILSLPDKYLQEISQKALIKVQNECGYENIYKKKIDLLQKLVMQKESVKIFPKSRPFAEVNDSAAVESTEEKGLLTIVIPYYNMGKYVEEAVNSIADSTYKKTEIIVVNDGSEGKENLEILDRLSKSRAINIIHKENEGLSLARNRGAREARGQFMAFLDPDDTVEPTYYEKAIRVLQQYENIYFVGCWAKYFGASKAYWPAFNPEPPYLLVHNMINSSALVYKKHAFMKSGINDPAMIFGMEDYESVISMTEKGYCGAVLPEPLWNYRVRKNSMARAFTQAKQLYLYRLIAQKHKAIYSIFASEVTNLLNANGPGFTFDNPTFFQNHPGNGFISNRVKNIIIAKIKSNQKLRKIAIKIKNSL